MSRSLSPRLVGRRRAGVEYTVPTARVAWCTMVFHVVSSSSWSLQSWGFNLPIVIRDDHPPPHRVSTVECHRRRPLGGVATAFEPTTTTTTTTTMNALACSTTTYAVCANARTTTKRTATRGTTTTTTTTTTRRRDDATTRRHA